MFQELGEKGSPRLFFNESLDLTPQNILQKTLFCKCSLQKQTLYFYLFFVLFINQNLFKLMKADTSTHKSFFLLNEFYYIYRCTTIITTKFYSISIPNPQCILSHLETISFSKSVSQYLFCKDIHCVILFYSTCK